MRLTIENLEDGNLRVIFNFKRKDYIETRTSVGNSYSTTGRSIIRQLELDGIVAEKTDIEDLLNQIGTEGFIFLSEREEKW